MVKIREVLRLQAEGHPQRKIAATVNCLCSTVQKLSNSACFMSGVRTKTIIGRDCIFRWMVNAVSIAS